MVPAVVFLMRTGYEQGQAQLPVHAGASGCPAAAGLERLTFRLHAFAFPIFTFAVIAGAIWAEAAWGRYWGWDPKETWAFISWVVYAGYLHARATPSVKRTVATWIAVLGFAHHADEPVRREPLLHRPALVRRAELTARSRM